MTIILDECLPKRLRNIFTSHTVWTVPQIGLSGAKDRKLLDELDKKDIDCFITIDGNIEYQQQFKNRKFSTIVIRSISNRYSDLINLQDEILKGLEFVDKVKIIHIPNKGNKK